MSRYSNVLLTQDHSPLFRLGFGGMGLGGCFGNQEDRDMIHSVLFALESGVNFIDTARAYQRSEELIGKALKMWQGKRPFIATKVRFQGTKGSLPGAGFHHPASVRDCFPPGSIRANVEASLREMGIDTIDLIQMHTYWPQWDDDAYWLEELHHLKREGKVRYIGVSLPDHRHDLGISLARSGLISSIQTIVNVFDSAALDSLVPVCQANGVAVLARVILDEGGLSGFLRAETEFAPKDYRSNYFDCVPRQVYLEKIDRLKSYIPEHAESLVELAIRFVLTHPGISAALTSMQVPEYAQQNIEAAVKPPISSELFEILKIRHRWLRNFYHERKHLQ